MFLGVILFSGVILGVILVSGVILGVILVLGVNFDSVFRSEFETRNLPENIREIWGPVLLQKLPDDVQNRCAFAVHKSVPPSCSDNFDSIRFFDISTRMHSSRLRIVRCNGRRGDVYPGGCLPGDCVPRAVSAQGGLPGGVCPGGCLPQCMLGYTPSRGQNFRNITSQHLRLRTVIIGWPLPTCKSAVGH